MTIVRRDTRVLVTALIASSIVSGCGFINRHFHKENTAYKTSTQERPLEVPPDLDKPNTAGALTIPQAGGTAAATPAYPAEVPDPSTGASPAAAPAAGGAAAPAVSAGPGATLSGDGLHVADTVESAWSRVGLALERSGAATISARDEANRSFDVQTTGQTTSRPGLFKRVVTLGFAKNKTTAQVSLKVRVVPDGQGSKVVVEGANDEASQDAARSLLATLRQRLS